MAEDLHVTGEERLSDKKDGTKVGSPGFLVAVTAVISVFATLMFVYFINGGVVFLEKTPYGNVEAVLPVCEVITDISNEFYSHDGKTPSEEEMVNTAVKAVVDSLGDPYSRYFTAEEYADYYKSVSGRFEGLGIVLNAPDDKGCLISGVYDDSPASEAGLMTGDIITAVNGNPVAGTQFSYVTELLTGKEGEAVVLDILRGNEKLQITAYYGDVVVKSVEFKMIGGTGYVYINQFTDNTADEFAKALADPQMKNMDSLIVDLRNNPGGYLNAVVDVADAVLHEGIIVSTGNTLDDPDLEVFRAREGGISVPLVVLVNENSASASEIFAAAIKENGAGTLIGMTTYGKGIVQSTGKMYTSDGYLKLTTSAYYTPNGNDIHKQGVAPDVVVDLDESLKMYIGGEHLTQDKDTQLQKALQWLGK
ncbi:MAG: S41 family peptidase [Clostridia bacterium]|nr:S41 family peptidase [Clostridia bacterium]